MAVNRLVECFSVYLVPCLLRRDLPGMSKRRSVIRCVLLSLILVMSVAFSSEAKEKAFIDNVLITSSSEDLVVYFSVKGCFTDKMERAILCGIKTTFTFYVDLYESRKFNFDRKIASVTTLHTVKYDTLKKTFYIYRKESNPPDCSVDNLREAESLMADVDYLKIVPLNRLERDRRYHVKIKAKLAPINLPVYLRYVLFFVSLWDFETDWHVKEFLY